MSVAIEFGSVGLLHPWEGHHTWQIVQCVTSHCGASFGYPCSMGALRPCKRMHLRTRDIVTSAQMHRLLTESIPSRRKGTRNLSKECAKRHRHRRARDRDLRARCRTESGIGPSSPAIPAAIPAARTSDSRSSQSLTVSAVDAFGRHSSLICKCTTGELLKGEHSRQRPGLGTNRVCNRKCRVKPRAPR